MSNPIHSVDATVACLGLSFLLMRGCRNPGSLLWPHRRDHPWWAVRILVEFGQLLQENAANFQHALRMAMHFAMVGGHFDF